MDDQTTFFINEILPVETGFEKELRDYASEHRVPILRRDAPV